MGVWVGGKRGATATAALSLFSAPQTKEASLSPALPVEKVCPKCTVGRLRVSATLRGVILPSVGRTHWNMVHSWAGTGEVFFGRVSERL